MINNYKPKNRMHNKRQAAIGKKIKKRNVNKISNQIKEVVTYFWYPKVISGFIVLMLLVVAENKINLDDILPVKSVKIEGEFEYLDKIKLRNEILPVVNGGFYNVNLPKVRNALISLPWVEDVSVRRMWPDNLLVRVIEKKPVVLWGDRSVISAKGKLFLPENMPVLKLPHLYGPKDQHKSMLQELARMQAWLLETGLQIKNIELNARRSWILTMTSGMELRLGRTQMHERLNRFVSVYKETLTIDKREIKHVDMRYTNGFSVAWKEA